MNESEARNENRQTRFVKVRHLTLTGVLFAVAIVLSIVESMLPPLPVPAPVKLGLANVVVVYTMYFLSVRSSAVLVFLKAAFALLTRGLLAGLLSLGGGLLSFVVMLGLGSLLKDKVSWLLISVSGSVAHNIGQLTVLLTFLPLQSVALMLPLLTLIAMGTGAVSALVLRNVIPPLQRAQNNG